MPLILGQTRPTAFLFSFTLLFILVYSQIDPKQVQKNSEKNLGTILKLLTGPSCFFQ
jgi:hypothetical protein